MCVYLPIAAGRVITAQKAYICDDKKRSAAKMLLSAVGAKSKRAFYLCIVRAAAFMRICSAQDQRSYSQKHSCRTSVHFAACFYFYTYTRAGARLIYIRVYHIFAHICPGDVAF
jgi:hypothetical protein